MSMTLVEELLTPKDQFLTETGVNSWFLKQMMGYDSQELHEFTIRLDKLKSKRDGERLIEDLHDSIEHLDNMLDDDLGKLLLRSLKLAGGTFVFVAGVIVTAGIAGTVAAGIAGSVKGAYLVLHGVAGAASIVKYEILVAALAPVLAKAFNMTGADVLNTLKSAYKALIKETQKKMATMDY